MTARPGSVIDTIDQDHAFAMRLIKERDALAIALRSMSFVIELLEFPEDISPELKASLELRIKLARSVLP